jgi:hypothetical protein
MYPLSLLKSAFRLFGFFACFSIPCVVIGFLADHVRGAIVGASISAFSLFLLGIFAERILLRILKISTLGEQNPGLVRTLERASVRDRIQIKIFQDPSLNALAIKGWGSQGTIILSQGLISRLSEAQLRAVLRHLADRCDTVGYSLTTLGAVIAAGVFSLAPKGWVNWAFYGRHELSSQDGFTPISAIRFLVLYPFARIFVRLGGIGVSNRISDPKSNKSEVLAEALCELNRSASLWSGQLNPGLVNLCLVSPWKDHSVLPLELDRAFLAR